MLGRELTREGDAHEELPSSLASPETGRGTQTRIRGRAVSGLWFIRLSPLRSLSIGQEHAAGML